MKKNVFSVVSLLAVAAVSCTIEDKYEIPVNNSLEFTATIATDDATRTTVDASDGKVSWEETDEITVKDNDRKTAVYKVKSIDSETGKATFRLKEGETALGDGPYTATYGQAPAKSQTYSAGAGCLPMTAPSTETTELTFTVTCGLLKLNVNSTGNRVKTISVTGTTIMDYRTTTTYTLTCPDAVDISSATDFYIALPWGYYTKIVFTDNEGYVCTKTAKKDIVLMDNHITPINFNTALEFTVPITTGTTDGHGWVQLWADGPKFAICNLDMDEPEEIGRRYYWSESGSESDQATVLWGSNWCVPTEEQMDELCKAASSTGSTLITCEHIYYEGTYGFMYKGNAGTFYESNTLFLPSEDLYTTFGDIYYWSGTGTGGSGRALELWYNGEGDWRSYWRWDVATEEYHVRPVLKD